MSLAEVKQKLHERIEGINDLEQLERILSSIDEESFVDGLTPDEVAVLEERHQRFQNGEEKAIPIDEFNETLHRKYGL